MSLPNNRSSSFKLKILVVNKEQLKFLDVEVLKNYTNNLEFGVFESDTFIFPPQLWEV